MAALLGVATLIGCGTGRTASGSKTIVAENKPNEKVTSTVCRHLSQHKTAIALFL